MPNGAEVTRLPSAIPHIEQPAPDAWLLRESLTKSFKFWQNNIKGLQGEELGCQKFLLNILHSWGPILANWNWY